MEKILKNFKDKNRNKKQTINYEGCKVRKKIKKYINILKSLVIDTELSAAEGYVIYLMIKLQAKRR